MAVASGQTMRKKQRARPSAGRARKKKPAPSPGIEKTAGDLSEQVVIALEDLVDDINICGADNLPAADELLSLQRQLGLVSLCADNGNENAIVLIERLQEAFADLASTGGAGGVVLSKLASALHPGFSVNGDGLRESAAQNVAISSPHQVSADLSAMLEHVAEQCGDCPFLLSSMLADTGLGLPAHVRGLMAATQAASSSKVMREAAVLQLLDPDPEVRQAAGAALQARIGSLSPDSSRRLKVIRKLYPDDERHVVDAVIGAALAAGIADATEPAGLAEVILASGIDGAGAQGFLIISPAGQRKQMSSVLLKNGVRDAWTAPPESRRSIEKTLAEGVAETSMIPVSRAYLDLVVRHHLQLGLTAGQLPPSGLLQVAETIGATSWHPEHLDWREMLAALLAELPADMLEPGAVNDALHTSDRWGDFDSVVESWFEEFEDDQGLAGRIRGGRGRQRAQSVKYVLQSLLERRRDHWAEHFLWTALWLKEAPKDAALPWREFAIVARAVSDGHDLSDIALMRDIAERTVLAASSS